MRRTLFRLLALAVAACSVPERAAEPPPVARPASLHREGSPLGIAYGKHGVLYDDEGEQIELTDVSSAVVLQRGLIDELKDASSDPGAIDDKLSAVGGGFSTLEEEIVVNDAVIRWALDNEPEPDPVLEATAAALRGPVFYAARLRADFWASHGDLQDLLDDEDLLFYAFASPLFSGDPYVDRCMLWLVPIPPDFPDSAWGPGTPLAVDVLAGTAPPPDVQIAYRYVDPNVPGVCFAQTQDGTHLDIVCQSALTGRACFWETFEDLANLPAPIPVKDMWFDGDTAPVNCTDCHRGNNAFIFHGFPPLHDPVNGVSPIWYVPVSFQPDWVNPPAFRVQNHPDNTCTTCHAIGALNEEYCEVVRNSIRLTMPPGMPAGSWTTPLSQVHAQAIDEIRIACENHLDAPCGNEDVDSDGIGDRCDLCIFGQGPGPDTDGDGADDPCDVCPQVYDPAQADTDHDGVGDECDSCRFVPNPYQLTSDDDGDGVPDDCDACPHQYQHPTESLPLAERECEIAAGRLPDGWCTQDCTDTSVPGAGEDNCPEHYDPVQLDSDGDGRGDFCDDDADNDGFDNEDDGCATVSDPMQTDSDSDWITYPCDCDDGDPSQSFAQDCIINADVLERIEGTARLVRDWGYPPFWDGSWDDILTCREVSCPGPDFSEEIGECIDILGPSLTRETFIDLAHDGLIPREDLEKIVDERILFGSNHPSWP